MIGGINFSDLAVTLGPDPKSAPVLLKYGVILQTIFVFLIIARVIFYDHQGNQQTIKAARPALDAPPPRQEILLEQIRDALLKR